MLVKLKHSGIDYEPGDHLAVYPSNHTDHVKVVCNSCIYDAGINEDTVITIKKKGKLKCLNVPVPGTLFLLSWLIKYARLINHHAYIIFWRGYAPVTEDVTPCGCFYR